jgi:hypothetical protein
LIFFSNSAPPISEPRPTSTAAPEPVSRLIETAITKMSDQRL